MASNDVRAPTPHEMNRQRLRSIVEAQLWDQVPHVYVVPEPRTLPGGMVASVFDDDAIRGLQALEPDPARSEDVSPETSEAPEAPALTERELKEWREQFIDKKTRARVRNALNMRRRRAEGRDPTRGIPHSSEFAKDGSRNENRGAPRKYTEQGALLKYAKQETT